MSSVALPVEVGATIAGKYRVDRVLGQGGMGVVVAAHHTDLDQTVAIKFLAVEGKGGDWNARFAREARAAAKIRNEHAVKVFDVGRLEDGTPYMVMEFLDGANFEDLLDRHTKFTVAEACDYLMQACEALAEAHLVGIVHRDLKPANLFLTHRSDGSSCVKIVDFGISKLEDPANASITHTQSLVGSPLYMSPERLRGLKDVDRRSDIWSLGVILQELLTAMPSFQAETIPDIHALVLHGQPTPLREILPAAPPELEALILRCLAKSPADRFQNVLEFATSLASIIGGHESLERIARIARGSGKRTPMTSSVPDADVSGPRRTPAHAYATESLPNVAATSSPGGRSWWRTGLVVLAALALGAVGAVLLWPRAPAPVVVTKAAVHAAEQTPPPHEAVAQPPVGVRGTEQATRDAPAADEGAPSSPAVTTLRARHGHDASVASAAHADASAATSSDGFVDYGGRN